MAKECRRIPWEMCGKRTQADLSETAAIFSRVPARGENASRAEQGVQEGKGQVSTRGTRCLSNLHLDCARSSAAVAGVHRTV